ncbi:MAG: hypothetical protein RLZZ292_2288 [Bacteroidota bacterium]
MNKIKSFLSLFLLGALIFLGSCIHPTSDNAPNPADTTATIHNETVPIAPIAIIKAVEPSQVPTIGELTDKVTNLANIFLILVTFLGTELWKWHDPSERVQNILKAVCITLSAILVLACYGVTSLSLFGVGSGVMSIVAVWKALGKQQ